MELFPAAFPALVVAHFLALLSPGPDFFLIASNASRFGLRGSRFICLGIALGNAIYISLALLGWYHLQQQPVLTFGLESLGAGYLIYLGYTLLSAPTRSLGVSTLKGLGKSPFSQLGLGLSSALLNPKNMLFYFSLTSVILGRELELAQQLICGLWMFSAVLLWDLSLALLFSLGKRHLFLSKTLFLLEKIAGCVFCLLGAYLLFKVAFTG